MKKKILFKTIILTIGLMFALPEVNYASGPDVVVNPVVGRRYSEAKVSVAYDGTIYYGRLYSTASTNGLRRSWEVLKSIDNGATFIDFSHEFLNNLDVPEYTNFEILAAGNDDGTFNLFVARSYQDDVAELSVLEVLKYNSAGVLQGIVLSDTFTSYFHGWKDISMVSDYHEKSAQSSPYSFSIAAVKSDYYDSIVVWTDDQGGANLRRRNLIGTNRYIKNVSIAVGTTSASVSAYSRLGITWDEYVDTTTGHYARIYAMFINAADGVNSNYSGPFTIGASSLSFSNPVITMSQKTDGTGTGIGDGDIRTIILYEFSNGEINGLVTDKIINEVPDFYHFFELAASSKKGKHLQAVYDPYKEEFLLTFHDQTDRSLPFFSKSLISPGSEVPIVLETNYCDISLYSTVAVKPRLDFNKTDGNVVFAWNDSGESMIEFYLGSVSIDEVSMESVSELLLFPNPATDHVNIAFNSISEQVLQLAVYDLNGKQVYAMESQVLQGENLININTDNLTQGQYVVMVSSVNNNYPIKLIIQ